jgi:hypothetical protein
MASPQKKNPNLIKDKAFLKSVDKSLAKTGEISSQKEELKPHLPVPVTISVNGT